MSIQALQQTTAAILASRDNAALSAAAAAELYRWRTQQLSPRGTCSGHIDRRIEPSGAHRIAVGKAEVRHWRRSPSYFAEGVSHRFTCQLPWRECSGASQPGSRRIAGRGPPSVPGREETVPTGFPPAGKRPAGNSATHFDLSTGQPYAPLAPSSASAVCRRLMERGHAARISFNKER
jgi:hypothetical protein